MEPTKKPALSDHQYNVLKWLVAIVLPAVGALYYGLSQIWGLPNSEEVVGTLAVIGTFGGVLLGLSTKQYNNSYDGDMVLEDDGAGGVRPRLVMDTPVEEFPNKDQLQLKIKRE